LTSRLAARTRYRRADAVSGELSASERISAFFARSYAREDDVR
jgi:hypothetical protein